MKTPNAELAYAALNAIDANRKHFNMGYWATGPGDKPVGIEELTEPTCGTTACFAGWVAALRGYRIDWVGDVYQGDKLVQGGIQEFAADLLGISVRQANELFFVDDDEITHAVAEIFGPRPERAP